MSKRKHSEIEDKIDNIPDRAVRIKASRLQAKISYGTKSLKDALNLARGFERQKMGRRQKKASDEPQTLLRLREENIVLRELDLTKTAGDYLLKQMVKTKRIRESEAFVALFGEDVKVPGPGSNATANVLGRLFKARPVLDVAPGIMDGIRQVLGLDGSKAVGSNDGSAKPAVGNVVRDTVEDEERSKDTDKSDGLSDTTPNAEINEATNPDEELDDDKLKVYDKMLAASSDDSDRDEQDNTSDLDPMEISDEEDQEELEDSNEDDDDEEDSISLSSSASEPLGTTTTTKHQKPQPPSSSTPAPTTTFLPSLNMTMTGYYSGSDTASNPDSDTNQRQPRGPALPKQRNNRRGQRERQQIAERKYGKNAKHLVRQQQQQGKEKGKGDRDAGWDVKRGAVEGGGGRGRGKGGNGRFGKGRSRQQGPTGANDEQLAKKQKRQKQSEGPLHPSWEAAKMKKKLETGKAAFVGKKITFE